MYVIMGASGYLGTYLIKNILEHTSEKVLAVARRTLPETTDDAAVTWASCDVTDPVSTGAFCARYLAKAKENIAWGVV